jgi:beta-fructofuranosidase
MVRLFTLLLLCLSLFSCSKKDNNPTPGGKVDTIPVITKSVTLYPLPPVGYVGDIMPYYINNEFQIFYLQDVRDGGVGYHPWDKFITKDLLKYDYKGEMIPLGKVGDQDLAIGTGSIIKSGNTYYAYYTGHNWQFQGTGRAMQAVMYATSTDLEKWTKKSGFVLKAAAGYDMDNFRDPLVVYNDENKEYMMIVGARINGKGVFAQYTTQDLNSDTWTLKQPFYSQTEYEMLECPDLFKWGNYWYLTFSDTGVKKQLHYRVSSSMNGPWQTPADDVVDGEYFDAAKTVFDGQNRYAVGWIASKVGFTDMGARDWGGNLAVHLMQQQSDGTLTVTAPPAFTQSFTKEVAFNSQKTQGDVTHSGSNYVINAETGLSYSLFNNISETYMITGTVSFDKTPDKFGFLFGVDGDINKSFRLGYDASIGLVNNRYNFGSTTESKVSMQLKAGEDHQVTIFVEKTICVMYVDGKKALSTRMYNLQGKPWGIFADKSTVSFKNLKLVKL